MADTSPFFAVFAFIIHVVCPEHKDVRKKIHTGVCLKIHSCTPGCGKSGQAGKIFLDLECTSGFITLLRDSSAIGFFNKEVWR